MLAAWMQSPAAARNDVRRISVELPQTFHSEWDALVALQLELSRVVSDALASNERPVILSGNCGPALFGALGALGGPAAAVCWFDAHGDFNTPETSPSGFLDGMALAIAVGDCCVTTAQRFRGVCTVPQAHVIHIGGRSFDSGETARFARSQVVRVGRDALHQLTHRLRALPVEARYLYLHIDLDVLDITELRANSYAEPGGFTCDELVLAIRRITDERPWTVAALTSLDPTCHQAAAAREVVGRVFGALVSA